MTTPYERFDAAAGAAACDTLTAIGSGLVTTGAVSLVTGVGGGLILPGMAALLASRYACSWDPDKPAPGSPPSALPYGCIDSTGNCIKLSTSMTSSGWVGYFKKFISLTDTGRQGGFGTTYWRLVYEMADGGKFARELPRSEEEIERLQLFTKDQSNCNCLAFNDQPSTITPGTDPGIPPTVYTDPESGCTINVEYQGLVTGSGGLASIVYKMSPIEDSRADGGVIGGCNFSPVIYTTNPDGGGGGGQGPFIGPWNPDWDGGGLSPWGDFLRDLAGGLIGNILYDKLSDLLEIPFDPVEYRIEPSCNSSDPPELPVVIEVPYLKGLQSVITRIDALVPLLQAQKDLKQPICRDKPNLEGEWRTISFRSEQTSPFGKSRLRKRFRYRSLSSLGLEQLVDHWADFSFEAGPVCVIHKGAPWGTPQVWAATADEGKRVIRHAAGEASIDPDQVGEWVISGSNSARVGVSGTMNVDTTGGYYWITERDGSNGRPIVAKT